MTKHTSRLYERVAEALTARIAAQEFPVGARLPSERDLAQVYDVSRPTVREAIIALELDGLVAVRKGSGVYVTAQYPAGGVPGETDYGPFELLEARRSIEAEACALAAVRVGDGELAELAELLSLINSERPYEPSEEADRLFHIKIAQATGNSAMHSIVEMLWEARARSPQSHLLTRKAHEAGIGPDCDEHAVILEALRARDPAAAREAMRSHLTRVITSLLAATEVTELEQARERVAAQRRRFGAAT